MNKLLTIFLLLFLYSCSTPRPRLYQTLNCHGGYIYLIGSELIGWHSYDDVLNPTYSYNFPGIIQHIKYIHPQSSKAFVLFFDDQSVGFTCLDKTNDVQFDHRIKQVESLKDGQYISEIAFQSKRYTYALSKMLHDLDDLMGNPTIDELLEQNISTLDYIDKVDYKSILPPEAINIPHKLPPHVKREPLSKKDFIELTDLFANRKTHFKKGPYLPRYDDTISKEHESDIINKKEYTHYTYLKVFGHNPILDNYVHTFLRENRSCSDALSLTRNEALTVFREIYDNIENLIIYVPESMIKKPGTLSW